MLKFIYHILSRRWPWFLVVISFFLGLVRHFWQRIAQPRIQTRYVQNQLQSKFTSEQQEQHQELIISLQQQLQTVQSDRDKLLQQVDNLKTSQSKFTASTTVVNLLRNELDLKTIESENNLKQLVHHLKSCSEITTTMNELQNQVNQKIENEKILTQQVHQLKGLELTVDNLSNELCQKVKTENHLKAELEKDKLIIEQMKTENDQYLCKCVILEDQVGKLNMELDKNRQIQQQNQQLLYRDNKHLQAKLEKKNIKVQKLNEELHKANEHIEEITLELNYLRNLCDNMIEYMEKKRMENWTEEGSRVEDVLDDIGNQDVSLLYSDLTQLAEGGCANIFRALNTAKKAVAVKEITIETTLVDKHNTSLGVWKTQIKTEVEMLKKFKNHPNIVQIYSAYSNKANNTIWIVLELLDCCLTEFLDLYEKTSFRISEKIMTRIFKEVLVGLNYLHQHHVVHRDIKSDNILLNTQGHIKLADFGMSCEFSPDEDKRYPPVIMGTIYWLAPEILSLDFFGLKGDIWSLGIVGREMIVGLPPYIDKEEHPNYRWPLLCLVCQGPPPLEDSQVEHFSSEFIDFLDSCLTEDYESRPSAEELLQHEFFKQTCSLDDFKNFVENSLRLIKKKV